MTLVKSHDAARSSSTESDSASRAETDQAVEIFSACPVSVEHEGDYRERVVEVARWSERHGCRGILVYADNRLVDPWMTSQVITESTTRLAPLVAVQPVYMHPYTVAKMIATLSLLYRRRLFINWVAGGFKKDLTALADATPHDERYERLVEYATIVGRLTDGETVTFEGDYYQVRGLRLQPEIPGELRPGFVVSGSSPAGEAASKELTARAVTYALPSGEPQRPPYAPGLRAGLRLGIIARGSRGEAWEAAYHRFPPDREGELTRRLARKVSDSHWHEELCRQADDSGDAAGPYWMVPFENYKTMCPYLVGSHDEVADELAGYLRRGFGTFILDEPGSEADLAGAEVAFELAEAALAEAA